MEKPQRKRSKSNLFVSRKADKDVISPRSSSVDISDHVDLDPGLSTTPPTGSPRKSPRITLSRKKRKQYTASLPRPNKIERSSSTKSFSPKGSPKKSSAFPGIPVHVVSVDRETQKLKDIQKKSEMAIDELEKLSSLEELVKVRIENLERREKELLKSCEKLETMSVLNSSPVPRKQKKKDSIPECNSTSIGDSEHSMTIDLRDIQVCELLGTGASGASVYLVNVGGWCCAMKELPRTVGNDVDSECFEKEMALLYQIPNHPNIARYLFHKKLRGRYCLFMSRYSGTLRGDIDKRKKESEYLKLRNLIRIAHEIANGLTFLHSQNIIHRDMKSDNIFIIVNRQGDIRDIAIGDFDTSKRLGVSTRPKSTVGTPGFMAPEVLDACGKRPYSYSADVFSFGMILYELMTLEYPYYDCTSPIAIASAVLEGREPIITEEQEIAYRPILPLWRECISKDPSKRPTASSIREKLVEIRSTIDKDRYIRSSNDSDSPREESPARGLTKSTSSPKLPVEIAEQILMDKERIQVSTKKKSRSYRVKKTTSTSDNIEQSESNTESTNSDDKVNTTEKDARLGARLDDLLNGIE